MVKCDSVTPVGTKKSENCGAVLSKNYHVAAILKQHTIDAFRTKSRLPRTPQSEKREKKRNSAPFDPEEKAIEEAFAVTGADLEFLSGTPPSPTFDPQFSDYFTDSPSKGAVDETGQPVDDENWIPLCREQQKQETITAPHSNKSTKTRSALNYLYNPFQLYATRDCSDEVAMKSVETLGSQNNETRGAESFTYATTKGGNNTPWDDHETPKTPTNEREETPSSTDVQLQVPLKRESRVNVESIIKEAEKASSSSCFLTRFCSFL